MVRPNFFIVGAPKCGTTSMYNYLRSHPNIFMTAEKEPHYFATDMPIYRRMNKKEEYIALFAGAKSKEKMIGESSVWYLFSSDAISLIKDFNQDAKILVFLRNPVDFVQSLNSQIAYNNGKKADFTKAWGSFEKRTRLIKAGLFGEQFVRLIKIFPYEQIHVVLLEDLQLNPKKEYLRILEFLELDYDGRTDFTAFNENKIHRISMIARFIVKTPKPIEYAWWLTKRLTGINKIGIMEYIKKKNTKHFKRKDITSTIRRSIYKEFSDDIQLLGKKINRDLSHWR